MRSGAKQTLLQILAEAVVDGQRDDQRGNSSGHAQYRNSGDHSNHRLAPLGSKIAGGDEQLKAHGDIIMNVQGRFRRTGCEKGTIGLSDNGFRSEVN